MAHEIVIRLARFDEHAMLQSLQRRASLLPRLQASFVKRLLKARILSL